MIIHPEVQKYIAMLGADQSVAVVGYQFPIPRDVRTVDISVLSGVPSIQQVVEGVESMMDIKSATMPEEMDQSSIGNVGEDVRALSYRQFKVVLSNAQFVIRTGDQTPYGAILLERKGW